MTLSERNAKIEEHNRVVLSRLTGTEKPSNKRWKDLTGEYFSRLKVVGFAGQYKTSKNYSYFWTQCECGSDLKLIESSALIQKKIVSCGCHKDEQISLRSTTHGLSKDPWYSTSKNQQQRMKNKGSVSFDNYGGRGLVFGEGMGTIEDRVLFYRENFGEEPPEGMQIDRPENDLGYAKDNVRLATAKENSSNKRNSHGHNADGLQSRAYRAWAYNKFRNNLCDEWAADFKVFLADIGGKDLPKGKYLARYDVQKPFAPDNYYFSDTIQRRPSYLMPK